MPDCADCRNLWAPRLPDLPGPAGLVGAIAHPECAAHRERVPVRSRSLAGCVSYLRHGFVKATFALTPKTAGAPWVGVVLADLPRGLPAVPAISGMGVHGRPDVAIGIATAEAVERYGILLGRSLATAESADRRRSLTGTAVAATRRTAVRRAMAECLERLAIELLCADGSAASAEPWPAGGAAHFIARAVGESKLAGEVFTATVLPGFWVCVVALLDSDGTPVAVGTAGAGSLRVARRRAVFEAYGLWVASAGTPGSAVTETDRQLLASLPRSGRRLAPAGPSLLERRPPMSATDIGTRLSDECGLHAIQVAIVP